MHLFPIHSPSIWCNKDSLNLERPAYSRGDPGVQPTAVQHCSKGSWAAQCFWGKMIDSVIFAYWLHMLVSSKCGLSRPLTSTVVRWAHCHKLALGSHIVICLSQIHFDQMHPSQPPLMVITWAGLREKVMSGKHTVTLDLQDSIVKLTIY